MYSSELRPRNSQGRCKTNRAPNNLGKARNGEQDFATLRVFAKNNALAGPDGEDQLRQLVECLNVGHLLADVKNPMNLLPPSHNGTVRARLICLGQEEGKFIINQLKITKKKKKIPPRFVGFFIEASNTVYDAPKSHRKRRASTSSETSSTESPLRESPPAASSSSPSPVPNNEDKRKSGFGRRQKPSYSIEELSAHTAAVHESAAHVAAANAAAHAAAQQAAAHAAVVAAAQAQQQPAMPIPMAHQHRAMTPGQMTPGHMTPGQMTPGRMTPVHMTPVHMTPRLHPQAVDQAMAAQMMGGSVMCYYPESHPVDPNYAHHPMHEHNYMTPPGFSSIAMAPMQSHQMQNMAMSPYGPVPVCPMDGNVATMQQPPHVVIPPMMDQPQQMGEASSPNEEVVSPADSLHVQQMNDLQSRLSIAEEKITSRESLIEELEVEMEKQVAKAEKLEKANKELIAANHDLMEANKSLLKQKEQMMANKDLSEALREQNAALKMKIKTDSSSLNRQVTQLERQVTELQEGHGQTTVGLESETLSHGEIIALKQQLQETERKKHVLEGLNSKLLEEIATLKQPQVMSMVQLMPEDSRRSLLLEPSSGYTSCDASSCAGSLENEQMVDVDDGLEMVGMKRRVTHEDTYADKTDAFNLKKEKNWFQGGHVFLPSKAC